MYLLLKIYKFFLKGLWFCILMSSNHVSSFFTQFLFKLSSANHLTITDAQ